MNYSNNIFRIATALLFFLVVTNFSSCVRRDCGKKFSLKETTGIDFELKDKVTGKDILSVIGSAAAVPDSIKLKNLKTGFFYQLFAGKGGTNNVSIYSQQYNRPADIVDSLVFYFGNSVPDTLIIHTGIVEGWRGDECPSGKDAGINKVTLRGQILVETTYDNPTFILRK